MHRWKKFSLHVTGQTNEKQYSLQNLNHFQELTNYLQKLIRKKFVNETDNKKVNKEKWPILLYIDSSMLIYFPALENSVTFLPLDMTLELELLDTGKIQNFEVHYSAKTVNGY